MSFHFVSGPVITCIYITTEDKVGIATVSEVQKLSSIWGSQKRKIRSIRTKEVRLNSPRRKLQTDVEEIEPLEWQIWIQMKSAEKLVYNIPAENAVT